jgi:radical SAM superfamily enzyme YgiQ (UPF0313 family)
MEPYGIYDEYKTIKKTARELSDKYPIEANYGSRCSLWQCGLRDGSVSKELFEAARRYYGKLWTYVGD